MLDKLMNENSGDFDARYQLGRSLIERFSGGQGHPDDPERAVKCLTEALVGGSDEYWTRFYRACAAYHLGKYDVALDDIAVAARLRPDRDDWASVEQACKDAASRSGEQAK